MNSHKTIKLSSDNLIMGFRKNDEIVVRLTKEPRPSSLVVLNVNEEYSVARFEKIDDRPYLWPPMKLATSRFQEIIFGEAIELIRAL
jgi:SOS-response transcriptional repressor LexA